MNTHTLKRADEPAFVVAAKNMADRFTAMGGKRSQFLEAEAKRRGFADWNTWRARGKTELDLPLKNGRLHHMGPGLHQAEADAFLEAARLVLGTAADAGYACDFSAPLVISSNLGAFPALSRASRGLALRRSFTPRSFVHVEGMGGNAAASLAASALAGYDGLLVFDMPGTSEEVVRDLAQACPGALILCHVFADLPMPMAAYDRFTADFHLAWRDGKRGPEALLTRAPLTHLRGDMWEDRMWSMLEAFSRSGQVFDSRARPELIDLDISHPEMLAFCLTIPGFDPVVQRGRHQVNKAVEQFRFISMQV